MDDSKFLKVIEKVMESRGISEGRKSTNPVYSFDLAKDRNRGEKDREEGEEKRDGGPGALHGLGRKGCEVMSSARNTSWAEKGRF